MLVAVKAVCKVAVEFNLRVARWKVYSRELSGLSKFKPNLYENCHLTGLKPYAALRGLAPNSAMEMKSSEVTSGKNIYVFGCKGLPCNFSISLMERLAREPVISRCL